MAADVTRTPADDIAEARRQLDALEREIPNLRAHLAAAERNPAAMHQAVRSARIVRETAYHAGCAVIEAAYGDHRDWSHQGAAS